jgi:hypothetical protein
VPDPASSIDGNVPFVVRKLTFQRPKTTIETFTFVNAAGTMLTRLSTMSTIGGTWQLA